MTQSFVRLPASLRLLPSSTSLRRDSRDAGSPAGRRAICRSPLLLACARLPICRYRSRFKIFLRHIPLSIFLFLTVGLDILKLISIFVSMGVFFSVCRVTQSNHMSSSRKFTSGIEKGLLDEIDIDTIITDFASRTVIRNCFK